METLRAEWKEYREKGRVKDDYVFTDQHQECFQELLDFLDKDSPDEVRFTVLKKIFLTAATETASTRDSLLPQQFMRLCRDLTSGEVLVLLAAHTVPRLGDHSQGQGAGRWLEVLADESGLQYSDLVEIHEATLIAKHLFTPRIYQDRSGVKASAHGRLTALGHALCEFIETYDLDRAAA